MIRRILTTVLASLLAVSVIALSGCAGTSGAVGNAGATNGNDGKKVVNIAIMNGVAFLPMYIAKENGWIDEALKPYNAEVHWTEFSAGPPMNESFAAGQQDIGTIGDAVISAIASGQNNKLVAVTDGPASYALIVKGDSPIQDVAALKGKKIGVPIGTSAHNLLQKALHKAGLQDSDVTLVNIGLGDAQALLADGSVDAVSVWEPFVTQIISQSGARELINGAEAGFQGTNELSVRSDYLKENPEIVQTVLTQYYRAAREYENNPEKYAAQVKKYYPIDTDLLIAASKKYNYVMPFSQDDIAALQDVSQFLYSVKGIPEAIEVKPYITNDVIDKVVAEAAQHT